MRWPILVRTVPDTYARQRCTELEREVQRLEQGLFTMTVDQYRSLWHTDAFCSRRAVPHLFVWGACNGRDGLTPSR